MAPAPANEALAGVKKECIIAERQREEFLKAFDNNHAFRRYMLQSKQSLSLLVGQHAPEMQFEGRIRQLPRLEEGKSYVEQFMQSLFTGPLYVLVYISQPPNPSPSMLMGSASTHSHSALPRSTSYPPFCLPIRTLTPLTAVVNPSNSPSYTLTFSEPYCHSEPFHAPRFPLTQHLLHSHFFMSHVPTPT